VWLKLQNVTKYSFKGNEDIEFYEPVYSKTKLDLGSVTKCDWNDKVWLKWQSVAEMTKCDWNDKVWPKWQSVTKLFFIGSEEIKFHDPADFKQPTGHNQVTMP